MTYRLICLVLLSSCHYNTQAQVCTGSLGENIFLTGDFGTGVENFLQSDPQIAPGYAYTTTPPPEDGLYSISNSTVLWNNLFPTWLEIEDNSTDPNGYMMVVNASVEPSLFYEQTVDGLCENTLYVFSVDIINMIRVGVPDHIRPNVSFLIDNLVGFTSGEIPQDAVWHNYGFTFTTAPGQTTVQLSLQNNAPGGIGNDLALDNISFRPCGPEAFILPETIANICEDGDPIILDATVIGDQYTTPVFQWQLSRDEGATWINIDGATTQSFSHTNLTSGFYYYRFLLANDQLNLDNARCRVISNEKIVFVQPKFYDVTDTICAGLDYEQAGRTYNQTGVFVDSLISSIGCDSIVTLDLTVLSDPNISALYSVTDLACHDQVTGSIVVENVLNAYSPFAISIDQQILDGSMRLDSLSGGSHAIYVVDQYGCDFSDTLFIGTPDVFQVNIGNDTMILFGSSILIDVETNYPISSYEWQADQVPACFTCPSLELLPFNDQDVILHAVSERGCEVLDTIRISVNKDRPVYIPNSFSPNGDNRNDYFNLFGSESIVIEIEKIQIFDRWGGILWSKHGVIPNSLESGWPGHSGDGNAMPPGVYLYAIDVRFIDGKVIRMAGDVLLVR